MSRCLLMFCLCVLPASLFAADAPPGVGDTVQDFELPAFGGGTVKLSDVATEGPVTVLVLRGFPDYQCPLCKKQVGQFVAAAEELTAAGARVLMIYPGDVTDLTARAKEFLGSTQLPDGYQLLLDPGYAFTKAWGLRWDASNETAFPSTFVIDRDLKVLMAKVSKSHGGRSAPAEVLNTLGDSQ